MTSSPQGAADLHKQQLILWAALLVSTLMYFVIARIVAPEDLPQENSALITGLMALSFALVAASFLIKRSMLATVEAARDPKRCQAALVLALALCEAAALIGLVVRLLYHSPQYYLFLLLGLAGIILHYPKRDYGNS